MKITITIPDTVKDRVETAFANTYGYQDTMTDEKGEVVDNTQTKADFLKAQLVSKLKNIVKNYESQQKRITVEATIDKDLTNIM